MVDRKQLVEALSRLQKTSDFNIVENWLHETRSEYLSIWRNTDERIEHCQGRYCAVDDIIVYIGKAEENLRKIKEREKESEYGRVSPI
jgi:hypothetical protein